MTPLEQQFQLLFASQMQATLEGLPDGSHLITVPSIDLPTGWSKNQVSVKFIAPVGYPLARPDCFWTDADLKLANGAQPQNTGPNAIPHVSTPHLWFSWHVSSWNPNNDNLLTYLYVIKRRLQDPR